MLRVTAQHGARLGRLLQQRRALETITSSLWSKLANLTLLHRALHSSQRELGLSAPHAGRPLNRLRPSLVASRCLTPRPYRRGAGATPVLDSTTQVRGLSSGNGDGEKGGGKAEGKAKEDGDGQATRGLFDTIKKTFSEEVEKSPSLKENLSKIKEAERKLAEDAQVRMKNIQGEASKYASTASEQAQKASEAFQEKLEGVKKTLKENLGKVGGTGAAEKGDGEGEEAENEFVRASKKKFSETQKALDENSYFSKLKTSLQGFREALANASAELVGSKGEKKESAVVKKLKQPKAKKPKVKTAPEKATDGNGEEVKDGKGVKKDGKAAAGAEAEKGDEEEEEEEEEEKRGVASLMIVKTAGEAWKRLQERLKEAPIIQELLGATRVLAKGNLGRGAKAATDKVRDKVEDVQEAWETSQHPLVYKVSSAWDSVTAENELGVGVRELRRLDHSFNLGDWKNDIQEEFLPAFMSAFLRGDAEGLKPWTGEACFNKLSSEIRQRKADGIVLDPHVLDVRQGEVVTIKADAGKANPTVAFQFMCQQINCVRNKEGDVVEGSEDDIRATYYMLAFQREFLEKDAELRWKVVDMMVIGAFPWY